MNHDHPITSNGAHASGCSGHAGSNRYDGPIDRYNKTQHTSKSREHIYLSQQTPKISNLPSATAVYYTNCHWFKSPHAQQTINHVFARYTSHPVLFSRRGSSSPMQGFGNKESLMDKAKDKAKDMFSHNKGSEQPDQGGFGTGGGGNMQQGDRYAMGGGGGGNMQQGDYGMGGGNAMQQGDYGGMGGGNAMQGNYGGMGGGGNMQRDFDSGGGGSNMQGDYGGSNMQGGYGTGGSDYMRDDMPRPQKEGEFQKFENYAKRSQRDDARDQANDEEYGGLM